MSEYDITTWAFDMKSRDDFESLSYETRCAVDYLIAQEKMRVLAPEAKNWSESVLHDDRILPYGTTSYYAARAVLDECNVNDNDNRSYDDDQTFMGATHSYYGHVVKLYRCSADHYMCAILGDTRIVKLEEKDLDDTHIMYNFAPLTGYIPTDNV